MDQTTHYASRDVSVASELSRFQYKTSKYRYKKSVKFVGWLDLIRSLVSMVLLVPVVVVGSKVLDSNKYAEVTVIFGTVHFAIQAFAAVALIDATTGGRDAFRSLWLIRIWWWSTIIFILLDTLIIFIAELFDALIIVVIPTLFFWIVKNFVDELKGLASIPRHLQNGLVEVEDVIMCSSENENS